MDCFETIASCSSKWQRVTCLLQLAMDLFFQRCEANCKTNCTVYNTSILSTIVTSTKKFRDKLQRGHVTLCNLPVICLTTPLRDKFQEKLHHVTLALEFHCNFCRCISTFKNRNTCYCTCLDFFFNPIAYGILGFSQLRGGGGAFWPAPQKAQLG